MRLGGFSVISGTERLRRILALAAPTSLLAATQVVAQLIEPWLAARQGQAALAGWAVVLPFTLLLSQMSAGAMGGGVVSAIARALGGGKRDEAAALAAHALIIACAGAAGLGLQGQFIAVALGITAYGLPSCAVAGGMPWRRGALWGGG